MTKKEQVPLSEKEMAEVQRVAKQYGVTEDQAATMIVSGELARRMRRRGRSGKLIKFRRQQEQ